MTTNADNHQITVSPFSDIPRPDKRQQILASGVAMWRHKWHAF